jgi:hypothetical protein
MRLLRPRHELPFSSVSFQPPTKEFIMKKNVGGIDRVLRIVAGLILVALAATGQIGAWGWLGIVVLATGLFSFCGAYRLLGVSTCPVKAKDQAS